MYSFKVLFESKFAANRIADVIDRNLSYRKIMYCRNTLLSPFSRRVGNNYCDFQSFDIKIQSFQIVYYEQTFNCNNNYL